MKNKGLWQRKTSAEKQWEKFLAGEAIPMRIGSSIWLAFEWVDKGGILEYHPDSDTFAPLIPYPKSKGFTGKLKFCKFKGDCIVAIGYQEQKAIVFDTTTCKYSKVFQTEGFIQRETCVVIGDYIHLLHRTNGYYTISSLIKNEFGIFDSIKVHQHFKGPLESYRAQMPVIKIKDYDKSSNKSFICAFTRKQSKTQVPTAIIDVIAEFCVYEVFEFGGSNTGMSLDSFYIGTLKNENPAMPLQWTLAPHYKLKQSVYGFGHIQHGHFIVIFGGTGFVKPSADKRGGWKMFNDIYILDLCKSSGWILSPIKCPKEMKFHAVLDANQRVHLQSENSPQEHWVMDLKDLIPALNEG